MLLAWSISLALAVFGILTIWWSAGLKGEDPWLSNLLANVGPTLVLAAPLSLLAFLLDRAMRTTKSQLNRLSLSLEELRAESGDRTERRLETERELFKSIQDALRFESLFGSLTTALSRGYITNFGIRVPFIWGQDHARFTIQKARFLRRARVLMSIERDDGKAIRTLVWKSNADVGEFISEMNDQTSRGGHLPQDFDPAAPFKALSELLIFTAECKHNLHASPIEDSAVLGGIDDWIFLDRGLVPKDTYYCVPWERLNKMDWLNQIAGKQWESRDSFPIAYHVAQQWYPALEGIHVQNLSLPPR